MKKIPFDYLAGTVAELVVETNRRLPEDILRSLTDARRREETEPARTILDQIIENARIADEDGFPLCQDTGVAVFFVDRGESMRVEGSGIEAAIQDGVRKGYREGGLRMSLVRDPLRRENTGDNTPAIIHYRLVPGDRLRIWFCPKGGGAENMSRLAMLTPGEGKEGVLRFVTDAVRNGGGKPCPPLIAGIGLGGDFEYCALLAKRSLLRKAGERNPDPYYAGMELELLDRINALGIGPMGLGGRTTALEVFIEAAPCHIASLPAAVNIQCHSARHGYREL
ncbi:MAG: fumarate hydratase [Candidatus Latescibacterota bacterium]